MLAFEECQSGEHLKDPFQLNKIVAPVFVSLCYNSPISDSVSKGFVPAMTMVKTIGMILQSLSLVKGTSLETQVVENKIVLMNYF